eukprot:m.80452 g.80452  ORF g.80452 m.80452 type:complete len:571 (-) comp12599_c0_seq7:45-1757(-)
MSSRDSRRHSSRRHHKRDSSSRHYAAEDSRRRAKRKHASDVPRWVEADKDGHLVLPRSRVEINEYSIGRMLGSGAFGKVYECFLNRDQVFAIKIIKSIRRYRDAADEEYEIFRRIQLARRERCLHIVHLEKFFSFHGHPCFVFECYGPDLLNAMQTHAPYGFDYSVVRTITAQILNGVGFLHKCCVTHTDLKPENILFRNRNPFPKNYWHDARGRRENPFLRDVRARQQQEGEDGGDHLHNQEQATGSSNHSSTRPIPRVTASSADSTELDYEPLDVSIVVADLGSATFDWKHHTRVITTRHYRAPEVILEAGWSHPADVWSIGCIVMEILFGQPLFDTHDNLEHLHMMSRTLDHQVFPQELLVATKLTEWVDDRGPTLKLAPLDARGAFDVMSVACLDHMLVDIDQRIHVESGELSSEYQRQLKDSHLSQMVLLPCNCHGARDCERQEGDSDVDASGDASGDALGNVQGKTDGRDHDSALRTHLRSTPVDRPSRLSCERETGSCGDRRCKTSHGCRWQSECTVRSFLHLLLALHPFDRATAPQALQHDFFKLTPTKGATRVVFDALNMF